MSLDFSLIDRDILDGVADAIRYVDGTSAGIAPKDFAARVRELKYPSGKWLYFTMPQGGTVSLTKNGTPTAVTLEYSLDNGSAWTEWVETENVRSLTLAAGQTMHVRNTSETSTRFSTGQSRYYNFAFTGDTYAGGNTDSLLCKVPSNAIITSYCFINLFKNAETLITTPLLPSITIAANCYQSTFYGCTLLTLSDDFTLPATTMATACYYEMFRNCRNLTLPEKFTLPATTLDEYCYYAMFLGCQKLILPETFVLPAKTLVTGCYLYMFYGCSTLNKLKTEMVDISASKSLLDWLYNTSPTGDFYCPAELTIPTGSSGIPSGWTRHDYPDNTWLHFTMPEGGTVSLTKNGTPAAVTLEYSLDNGNTWTEWIESENVRSLTLAAGQTMHVRNTSETSTRFSTSTTNYYNFSFTSDTYAGGNTNSLLCKIPSNAVITANCYISLFRNCTTLITPPDIPSTNLIESCYAHMFRNTGIRKVPDLPATMPKAECYLSMFGNCKNIESATINLTSTENYSLSYMFQNCTSFKELHINITNINGVAPIYIWLDNVSPTGDFYCPAELTIPTGASGIPRGWTRHDI